MEKSHVLILGCGYTGQRVARLFVERGIGVTATTRRPEKLAALATEGVRVKRMEVLEPETVLSVAGCVAPGVRVLHSIPVIPGPEGLLDPTPPMLEALGGKPSRIVYLSTTGVYGDTFAVDESTPPNPPSTSEQLRLDAERAVASGPWSSLILRPAAIYGPGRGVHESMRAGRYRLAGEGSNLVSRIHVEDLAALAEAALLSELEGIYPVADTEPCSSREMAQFCADLLGLPMPPAKALTEVHHTRRSNRKVDGRAIFRLLGVKLRYPSYRTGVPAALKMG